MFYIHINSLNVRIKQTTKRDNNQLTNRQKTNKQTMKRVNDQDQPAIGAVKEARRVTPTVLVFQHLTIPGIEPCTFFMGIIWLDYHSKT